MAPPRPIQLVTTAELYNRWAPVYDKDGNILQSIDDLLLPPLLSQAFTLIPPNSPVTVTELGCGTSRNTVKLLSPPFSQKIACITALDLSPSMLSIAQQRCSQTLLDQAHAGTNPANPELTFHEYDALHPSLHPLPQSANEGADIVLSTLVLEHMPLSSFFSTAKSLLLHPTTETAKNKDNGRGGLLIITNMHAEMGRRGQAGFVDPESGRKVRGESFVYEIEEVVEEGKRIGFVVEGEVMERAIREEDLEEALVGERGRKWVGVKVWFGVVMRFMGEA